MNWLIYALGGPAFFAINNLVDKYVLDRHISSFGAFTIIYSFVSFCFALLIIIFTGFQLLPTFSLALILLSGAIQIIIFLSYFKALTLDEASRVAPLFQMIPVFSLILGVLVLNETLKPVHIIGFFFIFFGGFALTIKKFNKQIFFPRPAFWLMMLASLGSAAIGVIFKFVVGINTFWQTITWENIGTGITGLILIFLPLYRKQFLETVRKLKSNIYGIIIFDEAAYFIGRVSFRYALTLAPVALVAVLMGTQPLFILAYAILLTALLPAMVNENINAQVIIRKLLFISLIFVGVVFLTFF